MSIYQKIIDGGGKIPRKLKKRIKKIPVGSYCYGSTIGSKTRREYGRKVHLTGGICPYYRHISEATEDVDAVSYCSFIRMKDDFALTDQVKICGDYEYFFPEFKHLKSNYDVYMETFKDKPKGMGMIQYLILKEQREKSKHQKNLELKQQHRRKKYKYETIQQTKEADREPV